MRLQLSTHVILVAIAAGLLTALPIGCSSGPPTGEVKGKVTFQGKPVAEGSITFDNPQEGGTAGADLSSDGTYVVKGGVVVGEYLVTITPAMHMVDTDPGRTPPSPEEKPAPDIPESYRMPGTTTLRATVKRGQNELNFDMTP